MLCRALARHFYLPHHFVRYLEMTLGVEKKGASLGKPSDGFSGHTCKNENCLYII